MVGGRDLALESCEEDLGHEVDHVRKEGFGEAKKKQNLSQYNLCSAELGPSYKIQTDLCKIHTALCAADL